MSITQHYNKTDNTLVIRIQGPFNFSQHDAFRKAYKNITPKPLLKVSVDLSHTDYMDSSALGMLLLLDEHFNDQTIRLLDCSDFIKSILTIVHFEQKFTIS